MDEQTDGKSCMDQEIKYSHGAKFCRELYWDVYCFECVDGKWKRAQE